MLAKELEYKLKQEKKSFETNQNRIGQMETANIALTSIIK